MLRGAIGTERALIARYRSAMAGRRGWPACSARCSPSTASTWPGSRRCSSSRPAAAPARPPHPRPSGTAAPGSGPAATLAALEAAESDAARSLAGLADPGSPALAQLMASIAASEASHALLLRTHEAGG